jgi:hypothetical protein
MTDYRDHKKTGGPGTAAITNDDDFLLDIPEEVDMSDEDYGKIKDKRSY